MMDHACVHGSTCLTSIGGAPITRTSGRNTGRWIAVALLILVAFNSCTEQIHPLTQPEQDEWNVRLVFPSGSIKARGRAFGHPLQRAESDWSGIVSRLQIKPRGGFPLFARNADPEPAFRSSEVAYLAARLAVLFQDAGPHEWVAFCLQSPHDTGATEVTTGAFFVDEGDLHLLLVHYRLLVTIPQLLHDLKRRPLNATGAFAYDIVSNPTWTVLPDSHWDFSKPPLARVVEVVLQKGSRPMEEELLEENLRKLKRLREQNLITEEDYRLKRDEALQGL
jgi:hypothetical protein